MPAVGRYSDVMAADEMPFMGVRIVQALRSVKKYKLVLNILKILQLCKNPSAPRNGYRMAIVDATI
jgi:hypothetical protein